MDEELTFPATGEVLQRGAGFRCNHQKWRRPVGPHIIDKGTVARHELMRHEAMLKDPFRIFAVWPVHGNGNRQIANLHSAITNTL